MPYCFSVVASRISAAVLCAACLMGHPSAAAVMCADGIEVFREVEHGTPIKLMSLIGRPVVIDRPAILRITRAMVDSAQVAKYVYKAPDAPPRDTFVVQIELSRQGQIEAKEFVGKSEGMAVAFVCEERAIGRGRVAPSWRKGMPVGSFEDQRLAADIAQALTNSVTQPPPRSIGTR